MKYTKACIGKSYFYCECSIYHRMWTPQLFCYSEINYCVGKICSIWAICKVRKIHLYVSYMIQPLPFQPNAGHEMDRLIDTVKVGLCCLTAWKEQSWYQIITQVSHCNPYTESILKINVQWMNWTYSKWWVFYSMGIGVLYKGSRDIHQVWLAVGLLCFLSYLWIISLSCLKCTL